MNPVFFVMLSKSKWILLTMLFLTTLTFGQKKANPNKTPTKKGETLKVETAHTQHVGLVKWLTFSEAIALNKKQAKPFLIDIYTDWCGWCKHMDKTTYSDQGLANYINTYFYPVKFDAETKDTIEYNGEKYVNRGNEKKSPHDLAIKLLNGKLSYPSTIFVNNNFQFQLLSQGFMEARKLEPLLIYTLENVYQSTVFETFNTAFEKTFYDSTQKAKTALPWLSMEEAIAKQKLSPRKMLVFINADFCNACKVFKKTSGLDTALARYLQEKFYLVDFNALETKDILFMDNVFKNENRPEHPFHSLALAMTRNNLIFPSTVILDEKNQLMDAIPFYMSEENLFAVARFFGDEVYKVKKWQDYIKEIKNPSSKTAH